jgi:steroid delta-isomerase-like uncharacterized protein
MLPSFRRCHCGGGSVWLSIKHLTFGFDFPDTALFFFHPFRRVIALVISRILGTSYAHFKRLIIMSLEQAKVIGQRFVDLFNNHDLSIADEIFAPNFSSTMPQAPRLDREGWKQYIQVFFTAFPDLYQETEEMLTTEDRLVIRAIYRGTHQGEFQGIPPSGKAITLTATGFNRLENGRIVRNIVEADLIGLMQQLGALPAPQQDR